MSARCLQNKIDCIYINNGKCTILEDTKFKRDCPFYKTKLPEMIIEKVIDGEQYRSIKGYYGKYFVSERGRVVNRNGRVLVKSIVRGYCYINLQDDYTQQKKRKSLAVIVADAWIGGEGKVGYIDGNPMNCDRWNLYRMGEHDGNEET